MKTLKVGLVQQAITADVEANKKKLASNVRQLAQQGAQLVVLQELHNSLYFCQTEDTSLFDLAEPIPGPSTQFYGALAAELKIESAKEATVGTLESTAGRFTKFPCEFVVPPAPLELTALL